MVTAALTGTSLDITITSGQYTFGIRSAAGYNGYTTIKNLLFL